MLKEKGKRENEKSAFSLFLPRRAGQRGGKRVLHGAHFPFFCKTITKKSTFFRRFRHFYTLFIYFIIDLFIYVWYNFF